MPVKFKLSKYFNAFKTLKKLTKKEVMLHNSKKLDKLKNRHFI